MKNALLLSLLMLTVIVVSAQESFHRTLKLMGSRFDITVVAHDKKAGEHYIDLAVEEIQRIEKIISSWDSNSQTSEINRNAGIKAVQVDQELFDLISRAIKLSKLTSGAFDISYASMDRIWKYDGSMTKMPEPEEIKKSVSKVGYHNIILDPKKRTVFLKLAGMRIGFGAIGKGYAADKAKALLIKKGVKAGIINASGDLNAWGKQPNGDNWLVAITNPLNKAKAFAWLPVNDSAVVTSGNYEKFVKFDGVRYSHIIDPRTGYPSTGIVSVSVFAVSAEVADALATAVFVMGKDVGLDLINQINGIECIIVDEANKIFISDDLEFKTEK